MKYIEALDQLVAGHYVARKTWFAEAQYCVIMPGMAFIWQIKTQPQPNAGVWMATVEDMLSEDWEVISKVELPKPEMAEAGQEAAAA